MIVPLQVTNYYLNNALAALIAPSSPPASLLAAAKMMLGVATLTPSLTTNYADLSEATFVGYAQSATIVWATPINDVDTTPTTIAPSHVFRATASTTPNQIYCFGVTDGVASPSTGILASAGWNPPIPIQNTGDGFAAVVNWNLYYGNGENVVTIIQ